VKSLKSKENRRGSCRPSQESGKKLKERRARLQDLSAKDVHDLVHELGTHQIELEMQIDRTGFKSPGRLGDAQYRC
jgi:hypothetical protein